MTFKFPKIYRAPADDIPAPAPADPQAPAEAADPPAADPADPPADPVDPPKSLVADADNKDSDNADGEDPADPVVEPLTAESITLPEGAVVDEAAMTGFLDLMNDTEISPTERAQKLIDLQFSIAEDAVKASQALWDKTQVDWQAEALALPEIGGDQLPKTLANIKAGLDKLGATEETYAALTFTGAGNHPLIISILSKATAHLVEGQPTKEGAAPAKGNLSQADRMYGNSNME